MKTINVAKLVLACCLAVGSMAASAAQTVDAENPDAILNIARGYGAATLEKDNQGDPKITGRIDGSKYGIFFYGCSSGAKCDDIQFAAAWAGKKVSLEDINKWNRDKRFGRAYLDRDNDPVLEMDVNVDHGVTKANLDDTFDYWVKVMKAFKKEVLGES